eukprot:CAMPEP_0197628590 /NCGR_PEP_ID=MMETSP1338-20131121/6833_1 /TAXON_ID=43686 ORGANISM="Pelagodinium beii, Strain RCC1491" /NCGR_SAMPLE_ID=MMETSP1338 /ASSEMBLY_ACC=CAM_ASM_000754 /LENGTH=230 /DNA_ID=CAMNT_0043199575 /DNA_START=58 /DNA_END=750 /DNA_ORIENTATION=-
MKGSLPLLPLRPRGETAAPMRPEEVAAFAGGFTPANSGTTPHAAVVKTTGLTLPLRKRVVTFAEPSHAEAPPTASPGTLEGQPTPGPFLALSVAPSPTTDGSVSGGFCAIDVASSVRSDATSIRWDHDQASVRSGLPHGQSFIAIPVGSTPKYAASPPAAVFLPMGSASPTTTGTPGQASPCESEAFWRCLVSAQSPVQGRGTGVVGHNPNAPPITPQARQQVPCFLTMA